METPPLNVPNMAHVAGCPSAKQSWLPQPLPHPDQDALPDKGRMTVSGRCLHTNLILPWAIPQSAQWQDLEAHSGSSSEHEEDRKRNKVGEESRTERERERQRECTRGRHWNCSGFCGCGGRRGVGGEWRGEKEGNGIERSRCTVLGPPSAHTSQPQGFYTAGERPRGLLSPPECLERRILSRKKASWACSSDA